MVEVLVIQVHKEVLGILVQEDILDLKALLDILVRGWVEQ